MSVKKFKVGDKVKVRDDITGCDDTCRDGVYISEKMAKMAGAILTIEGIARERYDVIENGWGWNDEMLEPAEKTLYNLVAGEFITRHIEGSDKTVKILASLDGCYLISSVEDHDLAAIWYTAVELDRIGYRPIESDTSEPTIEIDGKKYKKTDVKGVIKDLEPID